MLFKRFTNKSICLDHAPLVDVGSMRVGRLRPLPARATFTLSSIIYVAKRAHSTKDRKETRKTDPKKINEKTISAPFRWRITIHDYDFHFRHRFRMHFTWYVCAFGMRHWGRHWYRILRWFTNIRWIWCSEVSLIASLAMRYFIHSDEEKSMST